MILFFNSYKLLEDLEKLFLICLSYEEPILYLNTNGKYSNL